jgi:hypothetical protein
LPAVRAGLKDGYANTMGPVAPVQMTEDTDSRTMVETGRVLKRQIDGVS